MNNERLECDEMECSFNIRRFLKVYNVISVPFMFNLILGVLLIIGVTVSIFDSRPSRL